MELDSQIIKYMQKRAEYAVHIASAVAAQCFVLAVFFCTYGLISSGIVYSKSENTAKIIVIAICAVISIGMSVFNVMLCLKYKLIAAMYPDEIALRQSYDTVWSAFDIAKPVLTLKISISAIMIFCSGLVYIFLLIFLEKSFMAGIYGRIGVCILSGAACIHGFPAIDRIMTYKAMLKERYDTKESMLRVYPYLIAGGVAIPFSVCLWYIIRFYTEKGNIAFIVFPMIMLFSAAFAYLSEYIIKKKSDDVYA